VFLFPFLSDSRVVCHGRMGICVRELYLASGLVFRFASFVSWFNVRCVYLAPRFGCRVFSFLCSWCCDSV